MRVPGAAAAALLRRGRRRHARALRRRRARARAAGAGAGRRRRRRLVRHTEEAIVSVHVIFFITTSYKSLFIVRLRR